MNDNHLTAKIGQYGLIKNNQNEILLLERKRSKTWSLPGGRLNKNENPEEALKREIKEETGLIAEKINPFSVNIIEDLYQVKYCVYFEVIVDDFNVNISGEHSSFLWINIKDLENYNIEDQKIKVIIQKFLSAI